MASKNSIDCCYMMCAVHHSYLSYAKRKKVGAVIVTASGVLIPGVNGMAPGGSNVLEDEDPLYGKLTTKEQVIHAETNCLLKAAKEGVSVVGGTLYLTLSPCISCSEMVVAAGIKRVVYLEEYRCKDGIDNLISYGLVVDKLENIDVAF